MFRDMLVVRRSIGVAFFATALLMLSAGCATTRVTSIIEPQLPGSTLRIRLEGREDGNVIAHALGGHASNVVISGNLVLASFRNTFSSQLANALQAQGFGVLKNKEVGEASVTLQYGYRTVVPIIWTITKRVPAPPPQSPKDFSFDREVTVGERFGGIESLSFEIRFSDKSGKPLPGMLNVNSATSGNWDVELKEMARELAKRIRKNVPMEVGSR